MDDGVRTDADGGRFLCLRLTVYEDVHTALFKYLANIRPKRRSRLLLAYLSGSAGSERVSVISLQIIHPVNRTIKSPWHNEPARLRLIGNGR